jgi:hypothetical protein
MKNHNHAAYNLPAIISNFGISGGVAAILSYGSGHINDTFHLKNTDSNLPDYLLQRINHYVFKNVPGLMQNVQQVITHLKKKLENIPGADADREVLTLVPAGEEQYYYKDEQGNYWRMYHFLKDTNSYSLVETPQQAYQGGKAFGKFQALLSDMDVELLTETIPDFHNIESRLQRFRQALQADPVNRVEGIKPETEFILKRAKAMSAILEAGKAGTLPFRITHNDTKFNNVLLDKNDQAQCVIDLDTVMPGHVAYDFGDAIRTTVNPAPEDEKDLSKITVDIKLFEAFTKGFLEQTGAFLTNTEVQSLPLGALLLPYIQGVRFLTDFIEGDNYFKIHFSEHNLQRARAQFQLVVKLEEKYEDMEKIVQQLAWPRQPVI